MKILHINTYDAGGAAKAAYRLHQNLKRIGLDSKMVVSMRQGKFADVVPVTANRLVQRVVGKLSRTLRGDWKYVKNADYGFEGEVRTFAGSASAIVKAAAFVPDIIVAHWITNFLTIKELYRLGTATGAPLVWHLLDMAPMTGGCHYAWDCDGYKNTCGNCPGLRSENPNDISHHVLSQKVKYLSKTTVSVVCPTETLLRQARQSRVFRCSPITKIPLAVDDARFSPLDRQIARRWLELPSDRKIIFIGAQSLRERRKGMRYLLDALSMVARDRGVDQKGLLLLIAGYEGIVEMFAECGIEHSYIGFIESEETLAKAYQSADVFVCPSVEDSGPMINEAIVCGTPVVSFDMGVAPDLVHSYRTGYRANLGDAHDLAQGIKYVLELGAEAAESMSAECRRLGTALCHPHVQADAFTALFQKLCETKKMN